MSGNTLSLTTPIDSIGRIQEQQAQQLLSYNLEVFGKIYDLMFDTEEAEMVEPQAAKGAVLRLLNCMLLEIDPAIDPLPEPASQLRYPTTIEKASILERLNLIILVNSWNKPKYRFKDFRRVIGIGLMVAQKIELDMNMDNKLAAQWLNDDTCYSSGNLFPPKSAMIDRSWVCSAEIHFLNKIKFNFGLCYNLESWLEQDYTSEAHSASQDIQSFLRLLPDFDPTYLPYQHKTPYTLAFITAWKLQCSPLSLLQELDVAGEHAESELITQLKSAFPNKSDIFIDAFSQWYPKQQTMNFLDFLSTFLPKPPSPIECITLLFVEHDPGGPPELEAVNSPCTPSDMLTATHPRLSPR